MTELCVINASAKTCSYLLSQTARCSGKTCYRRRKEKEWSEMEKKYIVSKTKTLFKTLPFLIVPVRE